jgi:hypothetical protein
MIMEDRSNFGNKESFDIANDNFSQDSLRTFLNELIAVQMRFPQLVAQDIEHFGAQLVGYQWYSPLLYQAGADDGFFYFGSLW